MSLVAFTDGERRKPEQMNPVARERTRVMSAGLFARPPAPEAVPTACSRPRSNGWRIFTPPTLAITGTEDKALLHDIAAIFAARLPRAKAVVIPDAGHHPNLEQPERFNQIVATFLEEVEEG